MPQVVAERRAWIGREIVRAVVAPWSFQDDGPQVSSTVGAAVAGASVALAALLSTVLSTWTYLIGKGLLVTVREMDMGQDDLPADTVRQVAGSTIASIAIWTVLFALAIAIAVAVADWLYRDDRRAFGVACRRTLLLTVWFVVAAVLALAVNSVRQDEVRHPAAAVRAYAQLNQNWFRGSSADNPGPIEREPLAARGRMRAVAFFFPIVWAAALPRRSSRGPSNRIALIALAIAGCWLAWAAAWQLLPWTVLETLAG